MAYITPSPLAPTKGTPLSVKFTKSLLQGDASFQAAADAFFSDSTNWKSVEIVMKSTTGSQTETMIFDCDNLDDEVFTDFLISDKSRDIWEVQTVIVFDFDGGHLTLSVSAGQVNPTDFNFDVSSPPSYYEEDFSTNTGMQSSYITGYPDSTYGGLEAAWDGISTVLFDNSNNFTPQAVWQYQIWKDNILPIELQSTDTIKVEIDLTDTVIDPNDTVTLNIDYYGDKHQQSYYEAWSDYFNIVDGQAYASKTVYVGENSWFFSGSQFTITADNIGLVGIITITGDGVKTLNTLVSDFNIANPANTITLDVSVTDTVPNQETITLLLKNSQTFALQTAQSGQEAEDIVLTGDGISTVGELIDTYNLDDTNNNSGANQLNVFDINWTGPISTSSLTEVPEVGVLLDPANGLYTSAVYDGNTIPLTTAAGTTTHSVNLGPLTTALRISRVEFYLSTSHASGSGASTTKLDSFRIIKL
jgi:hypothetical protein